LTPGAQTKKIRYGPFSIGAMSSRRNQPIADLEKPCKSCYITAIQAGLEYMDGTTANIDTGAQLHHIILYNGGKKDVVCTRIRTPQRMMASGNERTPVRVDSLGKYGFQVDTKDHFFSVVELMNTNNKQIDVMITMTYEFVPLDTPGYAAISPHWLDVTNCGVSDVPAQLGKYQYSSKEWESKADGQIVMALGHVHDGGLNVEVRQNGRIICDSKQLYSTRGGFGSPPMSAGGEDESHISDAGICRAMGPIRKGDKMKITAYYDSNLHKESSMDGKLDSVMGIALMYVAPTQPAPGIAAVKPPSGPKQWIKSCFKGSSCL
jgi:hypothetical protein